MASQIPTVYEQIVGQPDAVFEGIFSTSQHSVHSPVWYRFMGDGSRHFHLMGRSLTACGEFTVPMRAFQVTCTPPPSMACPSCCAMLATEHAGLTRPEDRP